MPVITDVEPVATMTDAQTLYPIREVARLTGINPVTLRAWERRYGLIQPIRTESGHRLYSVSDIETVRQVMGWLERGVAVSKVAELLARSVKPEQTHQDACLDEYAHWQTRVQSALSAFDERELDRLYGQVFSSYPVEVVFQSVFLPLWRQLMRAQDEFGRTSEWLLLDNFLRARVQQRLQVQAWDAPHSVLLVAMSELSHELELLVAGLMLCRNDLAVRLLAMGQPLDELSLIADKIKPEAVVVFASRSLGTVHHRRLTRLAQTLNCSLLLAGTATDLACETLAGLGVGWLGSEGREMSQRLGAYLKGTLDT